MLDRRSFFQRDVSIPEILNVTTPGDSFYLPRFESPRWSRFLDSLKPLGLGLLLNNCQPRTRNHYSAFADHLTWLTSVRGQRVAQRGGGEGLEVGEEFLTGGGGGDAIAVVNNRCLCGLAYHMGFQKSALNRFSFVASIGIYKAMKKNSGDQLIRPKSGAFDGLIDFRSRALRIQEAYASVPKVLVVASSTFLVPYGAFYLSREVNLSGVLPDPMLNERKGFI